MHTTPLLRRGSAAAAVVLGAALLGACSPTPTSAGEVSAVEVAPLELTVGFVVDPSWAQIPVAADAGYFEANGLDVEVVNFSTGVEALQALAAGQVDVTTAADVPTSANLTKFETMRVIADGSRWTGSRVVARADSGITSIADLDGKSIGTPLGTSASYFAASVLERGDVDATLVQVAPSAMVTAAQQGDVDAVSIFQPYQAQVIEALGDDAVVLEGPEGTYSQHSLYLSSVTAIEEKPEALSGFVAALDQAGADLSAGTDESMQAVAAATQLDPDILRTVLGEFDYTLQLDTSALADELTALGTWAKGQGNIDESVTLPDYSTMIDESFLPAS